MSAIEEAFGVPAGHSLRLVRTATRRGRGEVWDREHEEYDRDGRLVAVFESWSRGAAPPAGAHSGGSGFVKYSPHGWVLRRSDADARRRAEPGREKVFSPMSQPPSLRRDKER
jgi:hypothetical protein